MTSRQYLQGHKKLEDTFTPRIRRIITAFRNRFIQDLRTYGASEARNALSKQMMNEDILKVLSQIYRTAGLWAARNQHRDIQKVIAQQKKAGGFGRNEQWIRDVVEYLRFHQLDLVSSITETMREDILKALDKSIEEGWTLDETVMWLRRANVIEARARVIARTEINRASNAGHAAAAKDSQLVLDKKWSAARDHRTRDSHVKVNNHITTEDGTFKVPIYKGDKPTGTFDEMQFPGDPTATPGNTINCRCRVVYVPKRDAKGKLLFKNRTEAPVIPMRNVTTYTDSQIAAQLKANIYIGTEK